MRILLIKPKQIGDSLILTPTIRAIQQAHPEADIWVVVRRGCEGILVGCPDIKRVLLVAPVEKRDRRFRDFFTHDLPTILQIAWHRFDYAFELGDGGRGRNLLRLARRTFSRRCFSVKPTDEWAKLALEKMRAGISSFDWATCHRVEKDFYSVSEFLPLPQPIPPMVFDDAAMRAWKEGATLQDYCVMQIGSRQGFNRWDREGWAKVGRAILKRFENIVISCGPVKEEVEEAAWLQKELGLRALNTRGAATWPEMAWLLHRAKLYIGPNTAAMHLAAACRCPVVALFGPSIEDHWHPWQVPYRIVTTPGYVAAKNPVERYLRIKQRTMQEILARDVVAACDALMGELGTPRAPQLAED
jgi:heptosyltransferase-3